MSEYINNESQREARLKAIILQLHEGKSVDDIKAAFNELLSDVGPDEVVRIEQALIAEGLDPQQIKPLCDVHVALFRDTLDAQPAPESTPGHPVFTYRAENLGVQRVLELLAEALDDLKNLPNPATLAAAREAVKRLRLYDRHYLRKENILFPYLERTGFLGPSKVMWAVHDDIRAGWKALEALVLEAYDGDQQRLSDRIDGIYPELARAIREMIYKEEKILFPTALERLTEQEWGQIRKQDDEIGYCYAQAGTQWQPRLDPRQAETQHQPDAGTALTAGLIPLSVGGLTAQQIDMMLKALPVDITYVNADDEVRYFSQTAERIFQRSPAIIGRKVQNCHPPQSVDRVQRILDDFRAGKRDSAAFWIQMAGMFIHIRYIALRDADGTYQGTLEVSQNIGPLRALEGERRLLDE